MDRNFQNFVIIANQMQEDDCLMAALMKNWSDFYTLQNETVSSVLFAELFRQEHIRIRNFSEEWIDRYVEKDFFNLFRMSRSTFEKLLTVLPSNGKPYTGGEIPINLEKSLLMTLWWLGKAETLISISDRFNVSISSAFNCTEYILDLIISLKNKYIVWPDSEEAEDVENEFKALKGFPGVIGALDGCNIVFKCPDMHQYSYIDKNKNHSFKIMAVATKKKIFTYVNCGFPGSAHDSRVFLNCALNQNIEDGRINEYFYQEKFHILGDKAFGLKNWLLTPYKEYNNLDERQRHYNTVHSKTRIVVEHTFGILKSRWRIMKGINVNSIIKAIKIGVTCTILHNFCYINADFWEEYEPIEDYENLEAIDNAEVFGVIKRDEIKNQLWIERNN